MSQILTTRQQYLIQIGNNCAAIILNENKLNGENLQRINENDEVPAPMATVATRTAVTDHSLVLKTSRRRLAEALLNASTPHYVFVENTDMLEIPPWRTDAADLKAYNVSKIKQLALSFLKSLSPSISSLDALHKTVSVLIVPVMGPLKYFVVLVSDIS